jgi:hypothetical protein
MDLGAYDSPVVAKCPHSTLRIFPGEQTSSTGRTDSCEVVVCCIECAEPLELRLSKLELNALARLTTHRGSAAPLLNASAPGRSLMPAADPAPLRLA